MVNIDNCTCGYEHPHIDMIVKIGRGLLPQTAEILKDFPHKILVVADKNTLAASEGLLAVLEKGGFSYKLQCYDNFTEADIKHVKEIETLSADLDGILAVGSGSIGDICRLASFNAKKAFAIFATAPSMDGFASSTAPITIDGFKESLLCHAPSVIIGDTDILAKAPAELKSAGFGDIMAKYVALADWKMATLVAKEYFCPKVADMVADVLKKTAALADKVTEESPEAAAALMEALVLSGLCMTLANNTRPASASEHLIAHYWEMKKLEHGEPMPFHGTKVGVATLMVTKLYHDIIDGRYGEPTFGTDNVDWEKVYKIYGPLFKPELDKVNNPSIMENTSAEILKQHWQDICKIMREELPTYDHLLNLMNKAKAVTSIEGIQVSKQLALDALEIHPYMRYRVNLTRLLPILGINPDWERYLTV
ncbi:MAG: sn-glycerol-1-phosphate dehydrogenase [Defluviitaleaceae bacterium]|nr:sn-glycerol-1-phosphate dehydrogenase [Defluviitaleaceae bacterium]